MSSKWIDTLATVAPGIASALGSPLAGFAIKVAADALGVESKPQAIEEILDSGDPNVFARLKQAERQYQIELNKLYIADRKSARDLFAKNNTILVPILAVVIVVGFFSCAWYVLTGHKVDSVLAGTVFGLVAGEVKQVTAFFFGSSQGSKQKTEALTDALKSRP